MYAREIVKEIVLDAVPQMHLRRCQALVAVVSSVLDGASLSVTEVGRGIRGPADEKHRIKRADRLVSNRHLHGERIELYKSLSRRVISATARPVVSVDWSNLDQSKSHFVLRAAVALQGRSFPVYEEVHPRARWMKPRTEAAFLKRLATVLGASVRPIIVTDAGFHNPWFRQVQARGWDFIGRVRGRTQLAQPDQEDWEPARALFAQARARAQALDKGRLACHQPLRCNFALVKQPRRGRHHRTQGGRRARGHYSNEQARSHREPWLLATSLELSSSQPLKRVVRAYQTRMQIEESFRDLKSERFGFGLDVSRASRTERIEVVLLFALVAVYAAWILGQCVRHAGHARRFQANTETRTRVLSTVYLGRRAWRSASRSYSAAHREMALATLNQLVAENAWE